MQLKKYFGKRRIIIKDSTMTNFLWSYASLFLISCWYYCCFRLKSILNSNIIPMDLHRFVNVSMCVCVCEMLRLYLNVEKKEISLENAARLVWSDNMVSTPVDFCAISLQWQIFSHSTTFQHYFHKKNQNLVFFFSLHNSIDHLKWH